MMRGGKILITRLGFIGRHVASLLVQQGFQVTALERKPDIQTISELGLSPVVGDVRDAELLSQLVPEFDRLVHTAGLLGTSEMVDDPVPAIQTNVVGAVNVFRRAAAPPGSVVLGDPNTLVPLGIAPESLTPFEQGIRLTVRWYVENPAVLT